MRALLRLTLAFFVWLCLAPMALAQQPAPELRIGVLYGGMTDALASRVNAITNGLRETLRPEGRRVEFLARAAEGEPARLPVLASEIVAAKVDVLVAAGPPAVRAARASANTIPVVALDLETNPVEAGLVSTLSHPGGNLTGVFFDFPDFGAKWLELLREAAPNLSRIAVFWDPSTGTMQLKAVEAVASSMGFRLHVVEVSDARNVEQAFRTAQDLKAEAVVFLSSPIFGSNPATSAKITFEHKLAGISMFPEFAKTGGLLAYGPDPIDMFRQTGTMVGKVLAGTAPADLPVERPARFQLVVNLKTARALGLTIPTGLLIRADEVIE
jgi:putative tryptophan/tyrosine transport system substrate-binding protein